MIFTTPQTVCLEGTIVPHSSVLHDPIFVEMCRGVNLRVAPSTENVMRNRAENDTLSGITAKEAVSVIEESRKGQSPRTDIDMKVKEFSPKNTDEDVVELIEYALLDGDSDVKIIVGNSALAASIEAQLSQSFKDKISVIVLKQSAYKMWDGVVTINSPSGDVWEWFENGGHVDDCPGLDEYTIPPNCLLELSHDGGKEYMEVIHNYAYRVSSNKLAGKFHSHGVRQNVAAGFIDEGIPVVSLGGPAGTGKTALALAAGLKMIDDSDNDINKIIVFRPVISVGRQDIGFLPGSEEEKMEPWSQAIRDAVEGFCKPSDVDRYMQLIEVHPLTHIRGRTFHNSFIIVDEVQSLDGVVLKTVLTRLGDTSQMVLTHDISQNDNYHLSMGEGIPLVVERMKESKNFAHIDFNKSMRSDIADEANKLLGDIG